MPDKIREITIYKTEAGRCPVADFIESIKWRADRAKIARVFAAVEAVEILPTTLLKKLKGTRGLWEIRVAGHRFIGFYATPRNLVLVHGFSKKSAKTPKQAIAVATERMKGYFGERRLL